jgi:hypothetical protein
MELDLNTITSRCINGLIAENIFLDDHIFPSIQVDYEREYFETHETVHYPPGKGGFNQVL